MNFRCAGALELQIMTENYPGNVIILAGRYNPFEDIP